MDTPTFFKDGRYHNLDGSGHPLAGRAGALLKWKLSSTPPELEGALKRPPAVQAPDPGWLAQPDPIQCCWLGHASWLVQLDGVNIVTDPAFGGIGPLAVVRRKSPAPLRPSQLPPIDMICISHNHYDHCDLPSLKALRALNPEALICCPSGLDSWLKRKLGGPVQAIEWWQHTTVCGLRVHAVPAQHWSVRLADDCKSHWCGFVFEGPSAQVYFAGDTADGSHFQAIAERHAIDVALLPIGAYAPRWFMAPQHMGPQEALAAGRRLGAHVLPMHWGTFKLTDEPIDEPPRLASRAAEAQGVPMTLLCPGGVWSPGRTSGRYVWPGVEVGQDPEPVL